MNALATDDSRLKVSQRWPSGDGERTRLTNKSWQSTEEDEILLLRKHK